MTLSREQQRPLLPYDYKSGLKDGQLQRRINEAFNEDTVRFPTSAKKWSTLTH